MEVGSRVERGKHSLPKDASFISLRHAVHGIYLALHTLTPPLQARKKNSEKAANSGREVRS